MYGCVGVYKYESVLVSYVCVRECVRGVCVYDCEGV